VISLAGPLPAEPPVSLRRRDGTAAVERHGAMRFSTRATLRVKQRSSKMSTLVVTRTRPSSTS